MAANHLDYTDEQFLSAFENLTIDPKVFTHEAHIRLAWLLLEKHKSLSLAQQAICSGIIKFASKFSTVDKYHETITVAFIKIIASRKVKSRTSFWPDFIKENGDLLDYKAVLSIHYSDSLLKSDLARIFFKNPDKQAI